MTESITNTNLGRRTFRVDASTTLVVKGHTEGAGHLAQQIRDGWHANGILDRGLFGRNRGIVEIIPSIPKMKRGELGGINNG